MVKSESSVLVQKFAALCGISGLSGLGLLGADAEAFDAGEDVGGGLCPAERLGVGVVPLDEARDGGLELGDALVDAAAYLLVGDEREGALDLVQSRRAGGREMHVPARALGQPVPDQLRLVRGVVVAACTYLRVGSHSWA